MSALIIVVGGIVLFYALLILSFVGKVRSYGIRGTWAKNLTTPFLVLKVGYRVSRDMATDRGDQYQKAISEWRWLLLAFGNFEQNTAMFAVLIRTILLAPEAERVAFLEKYSGSVIAKEFGVKGSRSPKTNKVNDALVEFQNVLTANITNDFHTMKAAA